MGQPRVRLSSEFRQFSCLIIVTCLAIPGCAPSGGGGGGGGGGGNGGGGNSGELAPQPESDPFPGSDGVPAIFGEPMNAYGQVEFPDGFAGDPSTLRIVTAADESPITPNEPIDYVVDLNTPSGMRVLTAVVDQQNRIVLLGYLYPFDNDRNPINTETTAIALLYFALGGWTTPQDTFDDVFSQIRFTYSGAVATVKAALDAALADDPGALADGDPRILDAIQEAQDMLLEQAATAGKRTEESKSASINQQGVGADGFIVASPSQATAQGGLYMRNDRPSGGLFGLNTAPRRGRILTYKTGYVSGGERTDLTAAELVGAAVTVPSAYSTGSSGGIIAGLITELEGGFGWKTVRSDIFSLDMHDGANVTYYELLLLNTTLDLGTPSPLFQEPKYALEDGRWMTELADLQTETFYIDYLIPVAEIWAVGASLLPEDVPDIPFIDDSEIPGTDEGPAVTILGLPDATRTAMLAEARALCDPVITGINLATAAGYSEALGAILARIGTDATFRAALTDVLYRAYGPNNRARQNFTQMQKNLLNMASAFSVVASVQYGIGRVSLGSVTEQLQSAKDIALWTATVSAVRLLPESPVVTQKHPSAGFRAEISSGDDAPYCYRWRTSGRIGTLVGENPDETGMMFSSSGSSCTYVADPGGVSKTPDLDTVSVDVYDMSSAGGNSDCDANAASGTFIGSASVTVAGDDRDDVCEGTSPLDLTLYNNPGPLSVNVTPRRVLPGDLVTLTISYDFGQSGGMGPFTGGVSLFLPLGCGYCHSGDQRCICSDEDKGFVRVDGQTASNVTSAEYYAGIGGLRDDPNFRPLRTYCSVRLDLTFATPEPNVPEVVTHEVEYRVSPDYAPCPLDRPGCYCAQLFVEPVLIDLGTVWNAPFIVVEAGLGSGTRTVELLNMEVDPTYDPETHIACPAEE